MADSPAAPSVEHHHCTSHQEIDMLKPKSRKKKALKMGFGACSYSGCNCTSYMGSADTCANCGHNYNLHW